MGKLWLNPIIPDGSFGTDNPRQNSDASQEHKAVTPMTLPHVSLAWQHAGQTSL